MRLAALVLLVLALLPVAASGSTRTARVTLPSRSPVTVQGTGFRPSERVAVTVSAKTTHRKSVTASRRGAFRTTFPGFSIGYCEAFAVRAKGSRGSSAFVKVIPECAQP